LDKLDAAQSSEAGMLLRRAIDLRAALKMGVRIGLDEIRADEYRALILLEDERDALDREQLNQHGRQ
jgi:hypothetical protein